MLILYVVFYLLALKIILKRSSFISLGGFFIVLFTIYYFIPSLFQNELLKHRLFLDENYDNAIALISFALLAFIIFYKVGFNCKTFFIYSIKLRNKKLLHLLFFSSSFLVFLGYFLVGGYDNIGNYGNESYSDSYASSLIQFHIICSLILGLYCCTNKINYIVLVTIVILSLSIFAIGVRSTAVSLLLPCFFYLFYKESNYKQLLLLTLGYIFLFSVQSLRGFSRVGLDQVSAELIFQISNLDTSLFLLQSNTFVIFTNVIDFYNANGAMYFASFPYLIFLIIPGPLRRVLDLDNNDFFRPSDWFMTYTQENLLWDGGGWAFSILAEFLINFGMLYFIPFAFLGYIFGKIDKCIKVYRDPLYIYISILLITNLLPFFRNDFVIVLKKLIYSIIISIIFFILFTAINRKKLLQ